ncbi:serine hydrolase domain-containing protein [Lentzea flava]|uniref:Serine hydrolase n=1 Tax=Lentzea flava TaxID=103732 RepID=A0ABQ2UH77_9PSEU|nr:serine hydrolase domain-containing protein [Lentzea flava]MCP2199060.1 CubicO group peptidase, beta-lactamase class C family [Lentzea flava]GGU34785.1 serine hydrolase [Lentzea flava]
MTNPELLPGGTFDRFVACRAEQDLFSGTVLLAHRGRPVLTRSYGMAGEGVPNGPDTVFSLASVTKCFTGLAIAQLVHQGKVAFHAQLSDYLTGFPAGVTVHQLLTHTSGLGRPPVGTGPLPVWDSVEATVEGTLALIRQTPPRFAPGTGYGYSNDAFWVLGAIVAKVSGLSYFDYVRRNVFAMAGMTRSDFHTRPQVLVDPRIARPYWTQPSGGRGDFTATPHHWFVGGPDGGAYATAGDLLRFATALRAGRLLPPALVGLVTGGKLPVPPGERPTTADQWLTGYGFEDHVYGRRHVFGHPGSGPGRATNLDVFPGDEWVAVVLGNYDTSIGPIVDLARHLVSRS